MQKFTVAIFGSLMLGLASLSPLHAQISGQVGSIPGLPTSGAINATAAPQNRADGQAGIQLADREGNAKVALGHAEYSESARRGKVFTLQASTTVIAQNVSAGVIGTAKPIVGFYNPNGSGVVALMLNEEEWHTSGTPGGPLQFNFYCGQNWTSVSSGTIYGNLLSNNAQAGSSMIPQNGQNPNTTPTILPATMNVLSVAGGPAAVAIATATGETGHSKDLKGAIAVPPGCFFGLFANATGTNDVLNASLSWEEVAQ